MDTEQMFMQTHVYLDTGKGFHEGEQVRKPVNLSANSFSLRFDLSNSPPLRQVRWDPVEGFLCQIWLDSAAWEYSRGQIVPLDVNRVSTNGARRPDGSILFGTTDPMVFLPVKGNVSALTVQGRWQFSPVVQQERFRISKLYLDDGGGCREDRSLAQNVYLDDSDFELTFETSAHGSVRMLCWHPAEGCICKVKLYAVTWRSLTGAHYTLDLKKVRANGALLAGGVYLCGPVNSMFLLPVTGDLESITIRGRWSGPLSQTEARFAKLYDPIRGPARLAVWLLKSSVRKWSQFNGGKRAA
jgi:hypothetical protein